MNIPSIKLSLKSSTTVSNGDNFKIKCVLDCYNAAYSIYDEDEIGLREHTYALFLDNQNTVIGYFHLSMGCTNSCMYDPKILFSTALSVIAHKIVFIHNHPSGTTSPSKADIKMTKQIKEGSKLLGMELLDHIIITPEKGKYYSFADEGLI